MSDHDELITGERAARAGFCIVVAGTVLVLMFVAGVVLIALSGGL